MEAHASAVHGAVIDAPRRWLRLEGALLATVATLAYAKAGGGWGEFAAWLLLPDVALLAYVAGPRAGAMAYNLAHTAAVPLALAGAGLLGAETMALKAALIWWAHIGFDRALGFGLNYPSGFGDTHLGRLGGRAKIHPHAPHPADR